ncbi:PorV/PorQ family protein [bacterium]|nr:PorV/PorQ family protein [bacterium]
MITRLLLCLSMGFPAVSLAGVQDAGTNNPFELGAGSRALALSGAFVAVADDVSSLFWNPGGLARIEQIEISAMHIELFFDTPYDFLGVAYPLLDWGTFALGAVRVSTEGIILRNEKAGIIDSGEGSLDRREFLIGFGREFPLGFQAGITVKIDQQRLLDESASGVGLDIGVLYHLPGEQFAQWSGIKAIDWKNLTFGLTLQNVIGSRLRINESADVLPLNYKAGIAYQYEHRDAFNQRFLVTGSWEKSTWRAGRPAMGLEYSIMDFAALRGGISSKAWTAGAGMQYAGARLDYALSGEALGLSHRFSLAYRFGTSVSEQRRIRATRRQAEIDRESEQRAQAAVEKTRLTLEKKLKAEARRYRREKKAMLAKRKQLIKAEQLRQAKKTKAALADEYFKALHYFQGIKDYLAKSYRAALVEFKTVAKYDPDYLELKLYLIRTRQRLQGEIHIMAPDDLKLYYKGIDLYIENNFAEAIKVWEKILVNEPTNSLALRNIEEAQGRIAKLKAIRIEIDREEKKDQTPKIKSTEPRRP